MHIPGDIAIDFNGDGVYEYGLKTYGNKIGEFYKNLTASSWSAYSIRDGVGTDVGMTEFKYLRTYYDTTGLDPLNDHWVIETGIPDSYFDSSPSSGAIMRWTMSCGNDQIYLRTTPEPATMSLLGLGFAGLLRFRKKKGACR